jgi:cardiolipin synthase
MIYAVVALTIGMTLLLVWVAQNLSTGERNITYQIEPTHCVEESGFERVMGHLLGPPIDPDNRITFLSNGDEIFAAMLAGIRAAKRSVTMETYIYWAGSIGREFSEALAERANAGVRVHILLDWFGSAKIDSDTVRRMETAGVEVERYHPLRWYSLSRMNSRTHRKLLIVDGRIGFIGGVGIADQWLGNARNEREWRDSHFQLEGPAVAQLQAAFMDNWNKTRPEILQTDAYFPSLKSAGAAKAQVFKSSPREGSASMRLMYLLSIAAAKTEILIANSYFVPDDESVEALIRAQRRGVRVEIIVPGTHSDTAVTRRASRSRWGPLLESGVSIWEYQPTMYHCKVMVIDRSWVSVGSTNFDNRSFRLNDEANLNVSDRELAHQQLRAFEEDRSRSRQISFDEWQRRPRIEKVIDWLAGLFRSQL